MSVPNYDEIPALDDPGKMFDLGGRVGLITGGAGKMGRQFAATLCRAGARVVIADLDGNASEAAASEIARRTGAEVLGMGCDVSDDGQVRELFARVAKECGRLDFLIGNVMSKPEGYYRPFEEYPAETWRSVLDANLTGAFFCCQEAAKLMKRAGGGSMVLTSSIYGVVAPDQGIYEGCAPGRNPYGGTDPQNLPGSYAVTKGGLISLARYLATLLGPEGIRVNALSPGGIYDGQEESFHSEYVRRTPMRRMGVWSDCNGAALFLVSDASRYMTGANLIVDGGWTVW